MGLTAGQRARIPEFIDKWIRIGLSTGPADRPRAEAAIKGLYALAKLREPRIFWLPCPLSAGLAALCHGAIFAKYRLSLERSEPFVYSVIDSAMRAVEDPALRAVVDPALRSAVCAAIDSGIGSVEGAEVDWTDLAAVRDIVFSQVRSDIDRASDDATFSVVRSALGPAVYAAVIDEVGSAVEAALDLAVYSALDLAIDTLHASAQDHILGAVADPSMGPDLRNALSDAIRSAGASYAAKSAREVNGRWADYSCVDYFDQVLGIAIDRHPLDVAESCGYYWALADLCFASERPSHIHRDGVAVPQAVIERYRQG